MPEFRDLDPEAREAMSLLAQKVLAQKSLGAFCFRLDDRYLSPPHVKLLVERLEALERRDIPGLIVEMPPRHSKTYHVSERFPAWYLGRRPRDHVILASYASGLALRNSRTVRNIVKHERYPFETKVASDLGSVERWETTQGGGVLAAGVGGGITGHGAELFVIDDPFKDRVEADSEALRKRVWGWYTEVAKTRLHPGGVMLITMTRWHEDDLVGRILNDSEEASQFERLRLPALAEPGDPLDRKPGEALWPDRYPVERLQQLMGSMSPRGRSALYQQAPTPGEGGTFRLEWMDRRWYQLPPQACRMPAGCSGLGVCDHLQKRRGATDTPYGSPAAPVVPDEWGMAPRDRWQVFMFVDTATKHNVSSDYTCIAVWGSDGANFYLLDVWRDRAEYTEIRRQAKAMWSMWRCPMVVEQQSRGSALIADLQSNTRIPVIPFDPEASKEIRADAVSPYFEAERVLLPTKRRWLDEWIEEHIAFPNGAHDDQVDTTSMALMRLGTDYIPTSEDFERAWDGTVTQSAV